jgi:hypothetical protein
MFPGGKGDRCVGLTTLPTSSADCLEMWEPQPPGTLRACPGRFTFYCCLNVTFQAHSNLKKNSDFTPLTFILSAALRKAFRNEQRLQILKMTQVWGNAQNITSAHIQELPRIPGTETTPQDT